ncbi:MAG: PhzF family phenazine biosynthesis protein [Armatimonadota bacterium]|nr:PhzF family phenazine biosynthesis protein [Armatimonadota bacterium]
MSRVFRFALLDAFTDTPFAGNPAGVVFQDGSLTDDEMRRIAGELHLETAFLSPALDGAYTVAYFTGAQRIPLCGHDTIAAATALAHTGRLQPPTTVRFLTDVGPLDVQISETGDVTMSQALPTFGAVVSADPIADALDLPAAAIRETRLSPQIVSTGTSFLLVPVGHRRLLNALCPHLTKLGAFLNSLPEAVVGLYAWTRETVDSTNAAVHARCFCPTAGLPEDPVTGTAAGALGAYFAHHGLLPRDAQGVLELTVEQGRAMGRPGTVRVVIRTDADSVTSVQVQGRAVRVAEGTLWA